MRPRLLNGLVRVGADLIFQKIKERYDEDRIYTSIGGILISINPYKPLHIYSRCGVDRVWPSCEQSVDQSVQPVQGPVAAAAARVRRGRCGARRGVAAVWCGVM